MQQLTYKWFAFVMLIFAVAATGTTVSAQPAEPGNPTQTDEEKAIEAEQQAKQLYVDGDMHYEAGRYEMALEKFSKAYELSKRPNLLFNIANVQERLGEYQAAADSLRIYASLPTATDVSSINERIKRLELNAKQLKERDEAERQKQAEAAANAAKLNAELSSANTQNTKRPYRLPGLVVTGVGMALIGGGIASGIVASNAGSDADSLCSENGVCQDDAQSDLDKQKRFALISDISIGVGIAAVGVGAYMLLRGPSRDKEKEEGLAFGTGPTNSGWGVSMMGSF